MLRRCFPSWAGAWLLCLASAGIVPALAEPADPVGELIRERGWSVEGEPPAMVDRPMHSSLVVHAMGFVGVPYRLGGGSYEQGFDCSGFVQAAFQQSMNVTLPRRAAEQAHATAPIDAGQLQPGDLVFFNTLGHRFSHVGIYVGDGRFIHSPRSGASVRLEDMGTRYWSTRFTGARRVEPPQQVADATPPAR